MTDGCWSSACANPSTVVRATQRELFVFAGGTGVGPACCDVNPNHTLAIMLPGQDPEDLLDTALSALSDDADWRAVLDDLPVPVYTTDHEGAVTYWNRACVEFAGREPELGRDRWCVTWQLYTVTGDRLPHEKCPMADAINQRRIIRGAVAIAMRPDGSRVAFRPYPTPLFNADGSLSGAVNLLIDVTDEQSVALHDQAERCRRLAGAVYNRETSSVLAGMAESFDRTAGELKSNRGRS